MVAMLDDVVSGCGLSDIDVLVGSIGLAVIALRMPLRHQLESARLLGEQRPLAVEMRTVSFLRNLDLDPVAVLGADAVEAADLESTPQHSDR